MVLLAPAGCRKPATIEQLVKHFESSGFAVAEPEPALGGIATELLTVYNQAAQAEGRPTVRAVMLDDELVHILRFESAGETEKLAALGEKMNYGHSYSARVQEAIGKPRFLHHANFVLLIMEGVAGEDNSEQIQKIEAALRQFKP
jgi:hypothetical protein